MTRLSIAQQKFDQAFTTAKQKSRQLDTHRDIAQVEIPKLDAKLGYQRTELAAARRRQDGPTVRTCQAEIKRLKSTKRTLQRNHQQAKRAYQRAIAAMARAQRKLDAAKRKEG